MSTVFIVFVSAARHTRHGLARKEKIKDKTTYETSEHSRQAHTPQRTQDGTTTAGVCGSN